MVGRAHFFFPRIFDVCSPCLFCSFVQDLTTKSFLEVCGDLNVVISILFVVYLVPNVGFSFRSPMALCLVGCKLLMAYFGQLCHCMSHTPPHLRPDWVTQLQNMGIMISAKEHNVHHKTYDDNFCVGSGICNPLIRFGRKYLTTNQWAWLGLFLVTLIADVPVFNYLLCNYAGFE